MAASPDWNHLSRAWHSRGYVPHFDMPGLVQMLSFRLADSISPRRLAELRSGIPASAQEAWVEAVEAELDLGAGNCWLRLAEIAATVEETLLHFDGQRYRLVAWVIMPNHVHVLIEMLPGWPLSGILHSWKSYTAKACNRLLGRSGKFWQEDYFDRVIRDERHLHSAVDYIHYNPVKARLCRGTAEWRWSSYRRIYVSKL